MNKRGFTLIEALASLCITSIIILLLVNLLVQINKLNKSDYASDDEISRAVIIKNIEHDFLEYKLRGINIIESAEKREIVLEFLNHDSKKIIVKEDSLIYDETYTLESDKASFSKCVEYIYEDLDGNYYLIKLNIPVLIDNVNNSEIDDIELSYVGLKSGADSYIKNYSCPK